MIKPSSLREAETKQAQAISTYFQFGVEIATLGLGAAVAWRFMMLLHLMRRNAFGLGRAGDSGSSRTDESSSGSWSSGDLERRTSPSSRRYVKSALSPSL